MEQKPAISLIEKPEIQQIYFLSDLHIRRPSDPLLAKLIIQIQKIPSNALLVFGGDIFHVFVGGSTYFEKKFQNFFSNLRKLSCPWVYLCGNHDFHQDNLITKYGGLYFDHPIVVQTKNKKFYFAHGDEVDTRDGNYKFLRKFFHAQIPKFLIQNLPGVFLEKLGLVLGGMSKDSRRIQKKIPNLEIKEYQTNIFTQHANELSTQLSLDGVFLGHNHVQLNLDLVNGGKLLNPGRFGDWDQRETYMIHFDGSKFQFIPL